MERKYKPGELVLVVDPMHPFRQQLAVVDIDPPMTTTADTSKINLLAGKNAFSVTEDQIRYPTEDERKRFKQSVGAL